MSTELPELQCVLLLSVIILVLFFACICQTYHSSNEISLPCCYHCGVYGQCASTSQLALLSLYRSLPPPLFPSLILPSFSPHRCLRAKGSSMLMLTANPSVTMSVLSQVSAYYPPPLCLSRVYARSLPPSDPTNYLLRLQYN